MEALFIDTFYDTESGFETSKFLEYSDKLWNFANSVKPFECKDIKVFFYLGCPLWPISFLTLSIALISLMLSIRTVTILKDFILIEMIIWFHIALHQIELKWAVNN